MWVRLSRSTNLEQGGEGTSLMSHLYGADEDLLELLDQGQRAGSLRMYAGESPAQRSDHPPQTFLVA